MNKTVTINISGIIFHIEEDAFEKLSKYLTTIRGYFNNADGGSEIMGDIEARIAEMLQSKTSAIKQVVLMSDVDFVMDSMGKPEVFATDSQDANVNSLETESNNSGELVKKRLYRDGDNKAIGGVCSGIAAYFDVDIVWIRLAMLLLTFAAGMSLWVYMVLWMVIPEAKTTAEKLAMRGEKADINNISKAVKEEAEYVKKRMEKYGNEFKNMANNNRNMPRNAVEKTVDFITDVLTNMGRVFLKIFGVLMVFFGVIFFFGFFTSVFGFSCMSSNIEVQEWTDMILLNGKDFYLGFVGITIFVGIPIIMMIYSGIKIIFKIKHSNRWLNLTAGIIWFVGFIMLLYVGVRTGQDFNKTVKLRENITVSQNDTLILKMNPADINYGEFQENDDFAGGKKKYYNHSRNSRNSNYRIGKINDSKYLIGYAQLNIIKSQTNRTELVILKEAQGSDKQIAKQRAQNISYIVGQQDSLISFDNVFSVLDADKLRGQDITVILKLPVGKVVYLDQSLEYLIYDIENVTNTYDGDMINRRWMMTENGLKCIDCDGLISVNDHLNDEEMEIDLEKDVQINVNGISINAKDAQFKMDSNGIKINSPEAKVVVNKDGVHVDSKKKNKN